MKAAPLEPEYALQALEDADDREQILDVLWRAARSRLTYAALLSVHANDIRAQRGADRAWRVPRGAVPVFEAAITSRAPTVSAIASGEPFVDGMLEQLGGASPAVLVLPIAIGGRTIAIVVGHRGGEPLAMADVADLTPLAAAASPAFERVLKTRAKATVRAESEPGYEQIEVIVPTSQRIDELRGKQAWQELADALRTRVAEGVETGNPDDEEQLELLIELGRIEADHLGRPDHAIEAWRSARTIDAGDRRALDALEAVFVQQGRWADCADLHEQRVALAEEPGERVAQLLELAAIAAERLDDPERAVAAYERVLHWEPQHSIATRELEQLYSAREQWEPLAALMLDRGALEDVARMYDEKLGDTRASFLVWLAVVRADREHATAEGELARLGAALPADEIVDEGRALAEELDTSAIWQLVATWARDAGRPDEAAHALDRACRAEADHGRRAELAADLGELYEALGDAPRAVAAYEQARTDEPESPRALAALHRLYRETAQWDALAEVIPDVIGMAERAQVVELQVELGDVLADRLARHDQAVAAYTAALALDPKHPSAFQGLAAVYQATGQTDALLDASEAEVDAAEPSVRPRRYGELAEEWRGRGRFDRAAALWQKAVDLAPKDAAAHRGLATALRGNEQWGSLAAELRALLDLVTAPNERLALLLELGDVLATQLDDQDGAVTAYQSALAIEADHAGALDALARLYERGEKTASAVVVLQRLLEHATDPRARAALFQRLGAAQLDARDVPSARLAFEQALALDLSSAAAHEGIARVHLLEDRAVAGGDELVRAAELAASPQDQIRCLVDAAWVFRHRVHDAERARQCLRLVLELDPAHTDAKQLLAELLQDTQQWESLWPHLQEEVQRAQTDAQIPPAQRAEIFARAARCAVELDLTGQALELYDLALAAEATPDLHLERADALYRSKALESAAQAYQSIVLRHAATLGKDRLVAVYRRLAEIHAALGKPMQAQLFHQKVLELDPHHKPTLSELAELHVGRGRYDEGIAQLRTLAKLAEPAERVRLLERIGDLYRDRLKNAPRAMSTFVEALEVDGTNRRILQRVLDLQTAAGQWKAAVETIGKFLEHETDRARRAAYHLAAAEIRRNELKDKVGALDGYEAALDELCATTSPDTLLRALETFRLIDELVTADKNWKYQEQAYRRMIRRVPEGAPALVQLWDSLGEVYRSRLKQYQSAIEAFETAHALDAARSPDRTAKLTELYALVGRKQPRAVAQRAAKLVAADPFQPESYRALGRASAEAGRIDEAWCAARALVFLKQATADEAALYARFRTHEARKATGVFDEASWAHVRHPDEDRAISAIFGVVWQAPVALRAGPAKAFELRPKERLPIEDGTRVIAKIFRHSARVLGVALPDVYVQPHRSGRLLLANCIDRGRLVPAVIVGRDLMTGYRDTELAAAVGGVLALLRPSYYLTLALSNLDELEATLGAACELAGRPGIGDAALRAQLLAEMQKRIPRRALESLAQLVAHLPEKPDVARWRACVDAASQRAGLLVGGELAAAARMLSTDAAAPGGAQRVRHLVAYSVSPAYFEARRHLGVAVA